MQDPPCADSIGLYLPYGVAYVTLLMITVFLRPKWT
jgi:hypothetical protein